MNFEQYILDKGYSKMIMDTKSMMLKPAGNYKAVSTYGPVDFIYHKEGLEDIYYGLYEFDKPPVWHWPKPWSLLEPMGITSNHIGNDLLNRVYSKFTNDEIYESINKEYGK